MARWGLSPVIAAHGTKCTTKHITRIKYTHTHTHAHAHTHTRHARVWKYDRRKEPKQAMKDCQWQHRWLTNKQHLDGIRSGDGTWAAGAIAEEDKHIVLAHVHEPENKASST